MTFLVENSIDINYVLGIIDACLFFWALFQLIRIYIYSKKGLKNLKPKLIFHLIIAISMLVRSGFFFCLPTFNQDPSKYFTISLIWFDLSSMLIFAGYGCLLLFWMELYSRFSKPYSSREDFWCKWKPYIVVFSLVLGSAIVVWLCLLIFWAKKPLDKVILDYISEGTISGLFLLAGFGFLCFGILLFLSFKKLNRMSDSIQSGSATHKLSLQKRPPPPEAIRAAVVGAVCTVCFCIRSIITLYSITKQIQIDKNMTDSSDSTDHHTNNNDSQDIITTKFNLDWEMQLIYFFFTEILPTILMMFRLRKMSKNNNSNKKKSNLLINNDDIYSNYSPIATNFNSFVKNQPSTPSSTNNPIINKNLGSTSNYSSYSSSPSRIPQSPLISSFQSSLPQSSHPNNSFYINNNHSSNSNFISTSSPIVSYQNPNMISPI
ncbi:hypothetical protein DLAC_02377 [Tieghemostelium lacteum]|uniref:THH1/TOM1/TOM3 domain-containing protein n=1 Tax=Tieghemostelium lacteum TaxID=361077 RepID=A0A152A595_TIELA|nr:hypothetical protein DLAC_02377 [Tieghemostelium lacteum]|eukprot:KYR01257.1 hypothetical protein DLAC_02377 [Tieghemostelium lacteum]